MTEETQEANNVILEKIRDSDLYGECQQEAWDILDDMQSLVESVESLSGRLFYSRKRAEKDIHTATVYRLRLGFQYRNLQELEARGETIPRANPSSEFFLNEFDMYHNYFCKMLLARRAGRKAIENAGGEDE